MLYNRTKIACKCLPVSNRCRKLKWSMQTGASHRWCVNLDLFRFDGGRDPQRCLGSRFMSSIKCFDLSSQGHTQGAGPFWLTKSNFFPWRWRRHTFSCLFLNESRGLSRRHSPRTYLRPQCLHSCDLPWLPSRLLEWLTSAPACTNSFCHIGRC